MGWEWIPGAMESLHGIEPFEVMQVLEGERRWPRPAVARDTGIQVLTIWGRTRSGRALMVGTRKLQGLDSEIFTARELTGDEVAQLEAWEATR